MPHIWIDLANSPQVLFFKPIIDELSSRGIEVTVTVRDFAQTVSLARRLNLRFSVVGTHDGSSRFRKGMGLLRRAYQLVRFYRSLKRKVDLALSHNSYHHILATRFLGIRTVTTMDFEGQRANHLAFRLAHRVIVPAYFRKEYLKKYGVSEDRVRFYEGLKEEVYLWNFQPGEDYVAQLGISRDRPVAVVRTPPDYALYHRGDGPFYAILKYLRGRASVILLPRTAEQRVRLSREFPEFFIPGDAIDGPRILYWADFSISGGGTMNRESALLGTPAYSTFQGEKPGVDEYLEKLGMLRYISSPEEIEIRRKERYRTLVQGRKVLDQIVGYILEELDVV